MRHIRWDWLVANTGTHTSYNFGSKSISKDQWFLFSNRSLCRTYISQRFKLILNLIQQIMFGSKNKVDGKVKIAISPGENDANIEAYQRGQILAYK